MILYIQILEHSTLSSLYKECLFLFYVIFSLSLSYHEYITITFPCFLLKHLLKMDLFKKVKSKYKFINPLESI